jgi:hypothetical protein
MQERHQQIAMLDMDTGGLVEVDDFVQKLIGLHELLGVLLPEPASSGC